MCMCVHARVCGKERERRRKRKREIMHVRERERGGRESERENYCIYIPNSEKNKLQSLRLLYLNFPHSKNYQLLILKGDHFDLRKQPPPNDVIIMRNFFFFKGGFLSLN